MLVPIGQACRYFLVTSFNRNEKQHPSVPSWHRDAGEGRPQPHSPPPPSPPPKRHPTTSGRPPPSYQDRRVDLPADPDSREHDHWPARRQCRSVRYRPGEFQSAATQTDRQAASIPEGLMTRRWVLLLPVMVIRATVPSAAAASCARMFPAKMRFLVLRLRNQLAVLLLIRRWARSQRRSTRRPRAPQGFGLTTSIHPRDLRYYWCRCCCC